jgi:hypothetical protein
MPSIQDVADQINARLDLVATNTKQTAQNTANILAVSKDMHDTLDAGFANLSQGLSALMKVQLAALDLLDHNRKQNETIICELVNSNQLLCNVMRKLGHQLQVSEASLKSTKRIEGIFERIHCCEAVDYDRNSDLIREIRECCPPEAMPEEQCPEVCETPTYRGRKRSEVDWKPLQRSKKG